MHALRLIHPEIHQDDGFGIKNRLRRPNFKPDEMLQHAAARNAWWSAVENVRCWRRFGLAAVKNGDTRLHRRLSAMRRPVTAPQCEIGTGLRAHLGPSLRCDDGPSGPACAGDPARNIRLVGSPEPPDMFTVGWSALRSDKGNLVAGELGCPRRQRQCGTTVTKDADLAHSCIRQHRAALAEPYGACRHADRGQARNDPPDRQAPVQSNEVLCACL